MGWWKTVSGAVIGDGPANVLDEYAERGAVFLPVVKRLDLSLSQEVFKDISGGRHSGVIGVGSGRSRSMGGDSTRKLG